MGGIVSCQTQKPQNQASLSLICTKRGLFFCLAFCVPKVRPILLLQQNPALGLLPSHFYLSGHKTQLEDVPWPLKNETVFLEFHVVGIFVSDIVDFWGSNSFRKQWFAVELQKGGVALLKKTRYVPWWDMETSFV